MQIVRLKIAFLNTPLDGCSGKDLINLGDSLEMRPQCISVEVCGMVSLCRLSAVL